jgi:hypothetical protein
MPSITGTPHRARAEGADPEPRLFTAQQKRHSLLTSLPLLIPGWNEEPRISAQTDEFSGVQGSRYITATFKGDQHVDEQQRIQRVRS